ncbi:hypothetical protein SAMN05216304_11096 [Bosea sp. OK403]|nr:hypothetical protein SAMN05216304_11096 [Bosea sp. OK403]
MAARTAWRPIGVSIAQRKMKQNGTCCVRTFQMMARKAIRPVHHRRHGKSMYLRSCIFLLQVSAYLALRVPPGPSADLIVVRLRTRHTSRLDTCEALIDLHIGDICDLGKAPLHSKAATPEWLKRRLGPLRSTFPARPVCYSAISRIGAEHAGGAWAFVLEDLGMNAFAKLAPCRDALSAGMAADDAALGQWRRQIDGWRAACLASKMSSGIDFHQSSSETTRPNNGSARSSK